ncbi:MAG: response regulator [Planctomycetes bacterium]|nr:response regulator [Planctomycetota bacterium]MCB9891821.1 response regulator [Planctomycetota bacterium]
MSVAVPSMEVHVLHVEDRLEDHELARRRIEKELEGCTFRRVDSLEEYLPLLRGEWPDLILSDYVLPRFDGMQALGYALEYSPLVPFIVLTGSISEDVAVQCLKRGAWDYVIKEHAERLGLAVRGALGERERRQQRRRLDDRLRKLEAAVDQCPVSIMVIDREERLDYVSAGFTRATGYAPEEVLGRNPRFLQATDVPHAVYDELWRTLRAGGAWRGEIQTRRRDGTVFWERVIVAPILAEDGSTSHYVFVNEDVTEDKRLRAQFLHAQRMEVLGRLAAGMAHDFNNAMTPIALVTDELSRDPRFSFEHRDALEELRAAVTRTSQLTHQLMSFVRQEEPRVVVVDVCSLVRGMTSMFQRLLGGNVRITLDLPPQPCFVQVAQGAMEQVLGNLVVNARDAMPSGGTLRISASAFALGAPQRADWPDLDDGNYVLIQVEDTGVGIPAGVQPHVFEPFFTTKGEDRGTGLGLATAKELVTRSGGNIRFESVVGRGTTFHIALPLAAARSIEGPDRVPFDAAVPATRRVLIVEDEHSIRRVTKRFLEKHGFAVVEAATGEEALEQLDRDEAVSSW